MCEMHLGREAAGMGGARRTHRSFRGEERGRGEGLQARRALDLAKIKRYINVKQCNQQGGAAAQTTLGCDIGTEVAGQSSPGDSVSEHWLLFMKDPRYCQLSDARQKAL